MSGYFAKVKDLLKKAEQDTDLNARQNALPLDQQTLLVQPDKLAPTMGGQDDNDTVMASSRKRAVKAYQKQQQLQLTTHANPLKCQKAAAKYANADGFLERGYSLLDLTEDSYHRLNYNPNTFSFWFPKLKAAVQHQSFFKVPDSKVMVAPIELAQYFRREFPNEVNQRTRNAVNRQLFNAFDLDENKTYFIKTGIFSDKFEYQNAHIDDPKAIGDYFSVISNTAMTLGAGLSNDLVVREYIADPENRPTMYDGMPIRTEFRAFIDGDLHRVIDIVPYWNNDKVTAALKMQAKTHINNQSFEHDLAAYQSIKPTLDAEFAQYKDQLVDQLQTVVDNLAISGCWSLDVMKSGDDFYLIDMATMATSGLTELVDLTKASSAMLDRKQHGLPIVMPYELSWKMAKTPETVMTTFEQTEAHLTDSSKPVMTELKLN